MKLTPLLSTACAVALATTATAQDADLLVFEWSGYEEEDFFTQYIEKHGDAPSFAFFGDEEEAFQKLRSGFKADIAHPCPQSVQKWRDADLIEPWDLSKIPSYSKVAGDFKNAPVLTDGDDVYFIPMDRGTTAVAYNTEAVSAEDVASLAVFHNPKYAGRISLPDVVDDAFALGFLATGVSDWTDVTADQVQAAADWLRVAHANTRAYWTDGVELAQLMATNEVLVAWSWNETPVTLADEGHPVAYNRTPVEGSSSWFCGYVNLKDAPGSEEKAHEFIEAWLQDSSAEYMFNEWGYGHANATAMATFDAQDLADSGLGPVDAPVLEQLPMPVAMREQMIAEFEKIKAGF